MLQLKSILLAIDLATRKRDELARSAVRTQQNLKFAQGQMDQLEGYAADTDGRWLQPEAQARSAELIRHHYQFMDRLQQAITLQSGVIMNTGKQVAAANSLLLQAEQRLAGLTQVLKVRQAELLQIQRRAEQRQTDEFAAIAYARRMRPSLTGD